MDSKAVNKLKIFKNEILVGILERTNDGCCIELTDEFKKTKKNLTFKISSEEKKIEFKGVGLPPYFAGLLPEGLRLKAFSYLIGNGDLHAKNISLTQKSESDICKLTPCYDLVCTALYGDQKMASMFLGKNQNLKKKNFIEFGQRYDIPEAATVSMLEKLVSQFEKNYQHFFSLWLRKKGNFSLSFLRKESNTCCRHDTINPITNQIYCPICTNEFNIQLRVQNGKL